MNHNLYNIIKSCNYTPVIFSDVINSYKNVQLNQALEYTHDDQNPCLGVQQSFNLLSGVDSSGSSYKYTTVPIIGKISPFIKTENEHFGIENRISNLDPVYLYFICIILAILLLIFVEKNKLK